MYKKATNKLHFRVGIMMENDMYSTTGVKS